MFDVYINNERHGSIEATDYREARKLARKAYGRRCDVIGPVDRFLAAVKAVMGESA